MSTWTHKYEAGRDQPGPAEFGIRATRVTVTAGLHHLDANPAPYFSVTCSIDEQTRNGRWREAGGGADHDAILQVFPRLAPVIALHLSDDEGVPMHAIDNALYFAGQSRYADARNLDALARHLRITPEDAMVLATFCDLARGAGEDARPVMAAFIDGQRERWAAEAAAAVALLDDLATAETSSPK